MPTPSHLTLISRALAGTPVPVVETPQTIPAYWGEGATAADVIAWFTGDRARVVAEGGAVDEAFYARGLAKYSGMVRA